MWCNTEFWCDTVGGETGVSYAKQLGVILWAVEQVLWCKTIWCDTVGTSRDVKQVLRCNRIGYDTVWGVKLVLRCNTVGCDTGF